MAGGKMEVAVVRGSAVLGSVVCWTWQHRWLRSFAASFVAQQRHSLDVAAFVCSVVCSSMVRMQRRWWQRRLAASFVGSVVCWQASLAASFVGRVGSFDHDFIL